MSDINFLESKKPDEDKKPRDQADKKIIWSDPESKAPLKKETAFSLLSIFNRKKENKKPAIQIKESREKILKLIKGGGREQLKEKKPVKGFFRGWGAIFNKAPKKEILVDYHQALNQEKSKRSQTAGQFQAAKILSKPAAPAKNEKPALNGAAVKAKAAVAREQGISKVLETNLIKGEIITFFDWKKKAVSLAGAILAPALAVGLIYFGLDYYEKYSLDKLERQAAGVNSIDEKIGQAKEGLEEITKFQTRSRAVFQVFSQHIYWTNFFKFLEDNTIGDVYYSFFTGDTGGAYTLESMAKKYNNISEQINVLRDNPLVVSAKTSGGNYIKGDEKNKPGIKFNFTFAILKKIFTDLK